MDNPQNQRFSVACLTLWVWLCPVEGVAWAQDETRDHVRALEQEIASIKSRVSTNPADPVALTKLAKLHLDLGDAVEIGSAERIAVYEEGAKQAKQALALNDDLPDAHFFYAANLGNAMQLQGVMASALVLQELKAHAQRTLALQSNHAPALHMMGRMLEELPWLLGGDQDEALSYLQKAVAIDEHYARARLDLAKLYLKRQKVSAAVRELQAVIQELPQEQSWAWKHRYRPEAERMLQKLEEADSSH